MEFDNACEITADIAEAQDLHTLSYNLRADNWGLLLDLLQKLKSVQITGDQDVDGRRSHERPVRFWPQREWPMDGRKSVIFEVIWKIKDKSFARFVENLENLHPNLTCVILCTSVRLFSVKIRGAKCQTPVLPTAKVSWVRNKHYGNVITWKILMPIPCPTWRKLLLSSIIDCRKIW